ncbi:MAG: M1 family metallopeptidase, partial [Anaerolineaceae bacterium]
MKRHHWIFVFLVIILASCGMDSTGQNESSANSAAQAEAVAAQTNPSGTAEPSAAVTPKGGIDWQSIPPSNLFDLPWQDDLYFRAGLREDSQHWVDDLPYASRYRMIVTLPKEMDAVTGRQEVLYTNTETAPLNEVVFRLFANINGGAIVTRNVRVNGQPAGTVLSHENSTLAVTLAEPLAPFESLLIAMDFEVTVPREMGGNYGLFGFFEDVLTLDLFSPMIPVYNEGWYEELPSRNGDFSYNDASFYLVKVIAPEDFVMAVSGVQVDRQKGIGTQQVTYALGPARDFTLAGSTFFTSVSDTRNGVTVNAYAKPGFEDGMELAQKAALDAIRIFDAMIGPYDYVEFDVAATPMQAGGIEYPGMTWVNQSYFNLEAENFGLSNRMILESVTVHEAAHQWFYNTVGNDQVETPWVDESLVQYVTGQYFLKNYGSSAFQNIRAGWEARWSNVNYEEIPIGLPTGDYSPSEYSAIVYGRGPLFFEALTEQMGAAAFGAFLKDY